jgi:hypothetical protein
MSSSLKKKSKTDTGFYINVELFQGLIKEIHQRMFIERSRSMNKGRDSGRVVTD